MESYKTVASAATAEFTEKRSRFIGSVFPITTEEEAQARIAAAKKTYWDARHNVYAYTLKSGAIRRFSDDGEPQGTAGMPVLDVLVKQKIENGLVIVTRYFGGILLGTGGLVRAYSHTASLAIEAAGIAEVRPWRCGSVTCTYPQYPMVTALVEAAGGRVTAQDFADAVTVRFELPLENEGSFDAALIDKSAGTLTANKGEIVSKP